MKREKVLQFSIWHHSECFQFLFGNESLHTGHVAGVSGQLRFANLHLKKDSWKRHFKKIFQKDNSKRYFKKTIQKDISKRHFKKDISKRQFKKIFQKDNSKRYFKKTFQKDISKRQFKKIFKIGIRKSFFAKEEIEQLNVRLFKMTCKRWSVAIEETFMDHYAKNTLKCFVLSQFTKLQTIFGSAFQFFY